MRFIVHLAGTMLAPVALQACPASLTDAVTGIRVTYATGAMSEFTRDAATGQVLELYSENDGYRVRNDLFLGLHLLGWTDLGVADIVSDADPAAGRSTYVFASELPPEIAPGVTWSVDYQLEGLGAGLGGTYSGQVGPETLLTIGTCTYASLPVDMYYRDADFTSLARVDYIPSLGFGVQVSWGEPFGQATLLTPTRIETMSGP